MKIKTESLEIEVGKWKTFQHPHGDDTLTILSHKGNHLKVLYQNSVYDVLVKHVNLDQKNFIINVEGFDFPVKINEPIDLLIQKMGFLKPNNNRVKEIKAPMPGLVMDVYVKIGTEVCENENLLSLEAMKMENILKSPGQGIIQDILVKKGDTVDKNQILIVFE